MEQALPRDIAEDERNHEATLQKLESDKRCGFHETVEGTRVYCGVQNHGSMTVRTSVGYRCSTHLNSALRADLASLASPTEWRSYSLSTLHVLCAPPDSYIKHGPPNATPFKSWAVVSLSVNGNEELSVEQWTRWPEGWDENHKPRLEEQAIAYIRNESGVILKNMKPDHSYLRFLATLEDNEGDNYDSDIEFRA